MGEWDETYEDTGCDLWRACLTCPLPACRYDLPPKRAVKLVHLLQYEALARQGLTVQEISARMRVSRRTVFRLRRERPRWTAWLAAALPVAPAATPAP